MPDAEDLARLLTPTARPSVAFDLPWPWGGEPFALSDIPPLTYITGPLGSGKTRLALRLAEALPGATFLGLDRMADDGAAVRARLEEDPDLAARVDRTLAWLVEDGATSSGALLPLLAALEAEPAAALVVDMPEQGLAPSTQTALVAWLRRRSADARPVFLLTRSSAILDLPAVGTGETILYCPANHAPPIRVAPCPGAPGFEAVASCLASPEVRARTAGMIAVMAG
ncbi:MAG TPA: MerR family transcriptional regulator, partial [Caulobacter sp.]|nr:MerR family transcriptional regulator [Caulobacter sp.]